MNERVGMVCLGCAKNRVDGEMMCVFTGNTLKNNAISFTEFPSFSPGNNTVSLGQNVTRITVNPRYRTL